MQKQKLRDHLWIWGHPTNAMYPFLSKKGRGVSTISPVEGLGYIGATNLFYNDYIKRFDVMLECERAKNVPQVGWVIERTAATGSEHDNPDEIFERVTVKDAETLVDIAKKYKNITIGIFDDFFSPANTANNHTYYTPEMVREYRETLNAAGIELWVVLYTQNMDHYGMDSLRPYLKEFDGVSLWFWEEEEVEANYDKHMELFLKETEGQKRMVGCYIYNFAKGKDARPNLVIKQLEKGSEFIKRGELEALIVHTNSAFGVEPPFEAVEQCREWIRIHGDEEVEG